ncbi:zf-TFIIB domain-containing protein [Pseudomonas sp. 2FE]|uniref:TFIIB-type zinc ribbon-containing protein n=1 Tax=Pseudomonas sp. 2FE TaxID=2502190 RepID=UPI0010F88C13|nr:zf-TFIIB domain-containing protein [Pseudomonas sp. 2FE]
MQCPVCKDIALVMTERQSIEIDYCPQCRGVWLDRGELDKIIERSQQQEAGRLPQEIGRMPPQNAAPEQFGYNRHGEHRGHHGQQHGRKSFWKEIFD